MLGHVVDEGEFATSEKLIGTIKPASEDGLMRFLGLVNFFAALADHFADKLALLYEILKEKVTWKATKYSRLVG